MASRAGFIGMPGRGSGGHLAVELFRSASKTDMVHVPYRGGAPALTDLLGGADPAHVRDLGRGQSAS